MRRSIWRVGVAYLVVATATLWLGLGVALGIQLAALSSANVAWLLVAVIAVAILGVVLMLVGEKE